MSIFIATFYIPQRQDRNFGVSYDTIDPNLINTLYTKKEKADQCLIDLLDRHLLFQDKIETSPDNELDTRRVAVVEPGVEYNKFKRRIAAQQKANKELIESAPMYFKESNGAFREAVTINRVIKCHVTINTSANSKLRTTDTLIRRARNLIRSYNHLYNTCVDEFEKEVLLEKINGLKADLHSFTSKPNKKYRLRTFDKRDIVAIYQLRGEQTVRKIRVTAGGLIICKSPKADDEDFKVINLGRAKTTSVYDLISPIPNYLEYSGLLYDEAQAEKARIKKKQLRGKVVSKIRPKKQKLVD